MNAVHKFPQFAKVVVTFELREDGGLRAFSDDVPGFVLSHRNAKLVLDDVAPALERILSAMWGMKIHAGPLIHIGDDLEEDEPDVSDILAHPVREYAAQAC